MFPARTRFVLLPLGGLALLFLALLPRLAWVPDDEMAPSFLPGDLVLLLPVEAHAGDVVAVVDPLDPSRWTLRRVETIGGAVRYTDGEIHTTDLDKPALLEMGRSTDAVVLKENRHLTQLSPRPVRWSMEEIAVPDDRMFLSADARDLALDSRWWGPAPLDVVQGVVVARVGPAHTWRGWFELFFS